MILFYTYRGKDSYFVHSSYVELGKGYYLPNDVYVFSDADYAVQQHCKALVEAALAKQKDVVLVDICEFDNDDEYEEEE